MPTKKYPALGSAFFEKTKYPLQCNLLAVLHKKYNSPLHAPGGALVARALNDYCVGYFGCYKGTAYWVLETPLRDKTPRLVWVDTYSYDENLTRFTNGTTPRIPRKWWPREIPTVATVEMTCLNGEVNYGILRSVIDHLEYCAFRPAHRNHSARFFEPCREGSNNLWTPSAMAYTTH